MLLFYASKIGIFQKKNSKIKVSCSDHKQSDATDRNDLRLVVAEIMETQSFNFLIHTHTHTHTHRHTRTHTDISEPPHTFVSQNSSF